MDKYFFLRIGANTEKQYVRKMGSLFSGLMVRANYFESAPGMLSALFLKFHSLNPPIGFIIDPVTYVFSLDSEYIRSWQKINKNRAEEKLRQDLHLDAAENIPSNYKREIQSPTKRQKNKIEIYNIKRAYRKLADFYFAPNIANLIGKRALSENDFDDLSLTSLVDRVVDYQEKSVSARYDTAKYSDFKSIVPRPIMILAPYFFIANQDDLEFMKKVWNKFDSRYTKDDGAIVLHCTMDYLEDHHQVILDAIFNVNKRIVFLWINGFDEESASSTQLGAYVKFVDNAKSKNKKIINLYAGGLSPFLMPFGLDGMVNNIGYGLQRDAEPVKGGIPTAQFYIPKLHIRKQVFTTYDLLVRNRLGNTTEDFYENVCSCPICKEGIHNGLSDFIPFYGEADYPKNKPESSRKYPTSQALRRCTFHFLFSRLKEYKWAVKATSQEAINLLNTEIALWRTNKDHLQRLKDILTSNANS